jgi:hypothetical protein
MVEQRAVETGLRKSIVSALASGIWKFELVLLLRNGRMRLSDYKSAPLMKCLQTNRLTVFQKQTVDDTRIIHGTFKF